MYIYILGSYILIKIFYFLSKRGKTTLIRLQPAERLAFLGIIGCSIIGRPGNPSNITALWYQGDPQLRPHYWQETWACVGSWCTFFQSGKVILIQRKKQRIRLIISKLLSIIILKQLKHKIDYLCGWSLPSFWMIIKFLIIKLTNF